MDRVEGVVTQVIRDRGFAFVRGPDKRPRFFHARDMRPQTDFDVLEPGETVSFAPVGELDPNPRATNNGLKAAEVTRISF